MALRRDAKYCGESVSVGLSACVCTHIKNHSPSFTKFVKNVDRLPWFGPHLAALQYVMYGTSGFVDDVMFSSSGPCGCFFQCFSHVV